MQFRSWSIARRLAAFGSDERGNIAIMTALTLSLLVLVMFGGTTIMKALSQRRELQSIAQAACNRAVKPQRLIVLDDAARKSDAQDLFDKLAAERGFTINQSTITVGWLEATVAAKATVPVVPGLGNQVAIPVSVSQVCRGIPPYPKLREVILSSNFKTPSGTAIELKERNPEPWGVMTPAQVGWDGGGGPGIEIQDWTNGFSLASGMAVLPKDATGKLLVESKFVVELDSGPLGSFQTSVKNCGVNRINATKSGDYNSSMYKNFELHPGTYRFSMWHRARITGNPDSTNCIEVSLEGTRPASAKTLKLVMNDGDLVWKNRSFDITIADYGLYKLYVAAAGCGDGSGGIFNDLKLEYIKRPSPEYSDPAPSPATDSGTPQACPVW